MTTKEGKPKEVRPRVPLTAIRSFVHFLLVHADEAKDADPAVRESYNDIAKTFREVSPGDVIERFHGLERWPAWIRGEVPLELAERWIVTGQDPGVEVEVRLNEGEEAAAVRAGALTLKGAVEELQKLISFIGLKELAPQDPYIALLCCAMARVYDLLPACCHMALGGPPSSGKSKALRAVLAIVNGEFVSDTTEAALSRALDRGKILGLDDADDLLRAHAEGMLEHLLRDGTDRKAARWIVEKVDDQHYVRALRLYRPCFMTYTHKAGGVALTTRTIVITMVPSADIQRVAQNLYPEEVHATLRIWLYDQAEKVRKVWSYEKIRDLILSDGFQRSLQDIKEGLPRDLEIALVLAAVAHMFGWEKEVKQAIIDRMKAAAEERAAAEEAEEVVEALALTPWDKPIEEGGLEGMWFSNLLATVNDARDITGERPMSRQWLGTILRKVLGLRDKIDMIKVRAQRNKVRVLRTEAVERVIEGRPPALLLPRTPTTSPTTSTPSYLAGEGGEAGAKQVASLDASVAPDAPYAPALLSPPTSLEGLIYEVLEDIPPFAVHNGTLRLNKGDLTNEVPPREAKVLLDRGKLRETRFPLQNNIDDASTQRGEVGDARAQGVTEEPNRGGGAPPSRDDFNRAISELKDATMNLGEWGPKELRPELQAAFEVWKERLLHGNYAERVPGGVERYRWPGAAGQGPSQGGGGG